VLYDETLSWRQAFSLLPKTRNVPSFGSSPTPPLYTASPPCSLHWTSRQELTQCSFPVFGSSPLRKKDPALPSRFFSLSVKLFYPLPSPPGPRFVHLLSSYIRTAFLLFSPEGFLPCSAVMRGFRDLKWRLTDVVPCLLWYFKLQPPPLMPFFLVSCSTLPCELAGFGVPFIGFLIKNSPLHWIPLYWMISLYITCTTSRYAFSPFPGIFLFIFLFFPVCQPVDLSNDAAPTSLFFLPTPLSSGFSPPSWAPPLTEVTSTEGRPPCRHSATTLSTDRGTRNL